MSKRKDPKLYSRGRPAKRVLKLDATPEEVARRIFDNATPPDSSKQKNKK